VTIKIVIQARLSSSRLPGKALLCIEGKTLLERVIDSALQINPDKIFLATSQENEDILLVKVAKTAGLSIIKGSLNDVRSRFVSVCQQDPEALIIRFTADNPLHSPKLARELLSRFDNSSDYVCLAYSPEKIIEGTGCEIFRAKYLIHHSNANDSDFDKEHVTPILYKHGGSQVNPNIVNNLFSNLSLTIDTLMNFVNVLQATQGLWDLPCDQIINTVVNSPERYKFVQYRNHVQ